MCFLRSLLLAVNAAGLIFLICIPRAVASGPGIRWEIANRFRYFYTSDFRKIAEVYEGLKTTDNLRPSALQLELALERKAIDKGSLDGWFADVFKNTCKTEATHTHAGCKMENGDGYLEPMTADVILNADGIDSEKCEWRIDDTVVEEKTCKGAVAHNVKYSGSHEIKLTPSNGAPLTSTIALKDILIVSFGDSFSSGEGNPEKKVTLVDYPFSNYTNSSGGQEFPVRMPLYLVKDNPDEFYKTRAPQWTNTQCHRSLYSQHTKAALQYALEHPHLTVTFLNYSCTGAEVYEGILNAWWGRDDIDHQYYDDAPQLVKALRDLCKDSEPYKNTEWAFRGRGQDKKYNSKPADFPECTSFVRRPDVVLLSIGGNDVGFARMIANAALAAMPNARAANWVYGIWRWAARPQSFKTGLKLANDRISLRYKALDGMLRKYLEVASKKVILTAYPQLAYDENGKLCVSGNKGMDVHRIFGMKEKAFLESRNFTNSFYAIMKRAAADRHWLFADEHIAQDGAPNNFAKDSVGTGHGICAAGVDEGLTKFPRPKPGTTPPAEWTPFQPENWNPYSSPRDRWFVTPNDAFLTTNYHSADVAAVDDIVQPLYAATLSGSFHPNALGHAAVADAVLIKLREALPDFEK